jgi:hypothetical protein
MDSFQTTIVTCIVHGILSILDHTCTFFKNAIQVVQTHDSLIFGVLSIRGPPCLNFFFSKCMWHETGQFNIEKNHGNTWFIFSWSTHLCTFPNWRPGARYCLQEFQTLICTVNAYLSYNTNVQRIAGFDNICFILSKLTKKCNCWDIRETFFMTRTAIFCQSYWATTSLGIIFFPISI